MKSCADICEFGLWLEIVQPLVEKIGEKWNGRYPWDWYNDVGFLIGYEPEVRIRLVDEAMERFKAIFGYYPEAVGSWHVDAVSLAHLEEKYHIKACCICRDQVGMDGYTLQGGYYHQAYYPSKYNMFCTGLAFQYTQVGQENSFGWPKMQEGLTYQMAQVQKLVEEGKAEVMTLGESGKWFKASFEIFRLWTAYCFRMRAMRRWQVYIFR